MATAKGNSIKNYDTNPIINFYLQFNYQTLRYDFIGVDGDNGYDATFSFTQFSDAIINNNSFIWHELTGSIHGVGLFLDQFSIPSIKINSLPRNQKSQEEKEGQKEKGGEVNQND